MFFASHYPFEVMVGISCTGGRGCNQFEPLPK